MSGSSTAHGPQSAERDETQCGEARLHFRSKAKLQWPIEFEIVDRGGRDRTAIQAPHHRGTTYGIGIGGTFITTDLRPEVGSSVRLWLFVPSLENDGPPTVIRLHGEVRWVSDMRNETQSGGFGVAFRALTAQDEVRLHAHFSRFDGL